MLWYVIAISLSIVLCEDDMVGVRKCCADSQALSLDYYQCREINGYDTIERRKRLEIALKSQGLDLAGTYGFPQCNIDDTFLNRPLEDVSRTMMDQFTDICVDVSANHSIVWVACVPNKITPLLSNQVSIRKCCSMFEMVVQGVGQCNATDQEFQPEFYDINNLNSTLKLEMFAKDVDIMTPGCENKELLNEGEGWVLGNGSLFALNSFMLGRDSFCVDNVIGFSGVQIFSCHLEEEEKSSKIEFFLISLGLIISIVFLILTFLIYASGWKKQNSYGRSLVCHLGSMIFAYFCLAALQLQTLGLSIPKGLCDLIAYIMLLAFLAAFFWLNIMCFDIWRTFRSIRPRDSIQRGPKILRFLLYSIYGWGMPIKLTLITMVVSSYKLLPDLFLPVIENCWLSRNTYGYYLFFIAPISAIILCNLVLYVITAWKCYQVKKDIRNRSRLDKKRETNFFKKKEQLMLNIKLFVVMGITWSMEVVSFLFKHELKESTPFYIWYITDTINALYGLIIFLIFAIKKKNIRKITRRISGWVDSQRRSGSESLIDYRKSSTTINPSTIDTSLGETGVSQDTDVTC